MAQSLASAAEHNPLSNSAARAGTIRDAVRWIAEHRAEVKALNAEINEFMVKTVKGDLGFKIADFNAIYRVSQLEIEDRDTLLETIREGFAALQITFDWLNEAPEQQAPKRPAAARRPRGRPRKQPALSLSNGHEDGGDAAASPVQ